MTVSLIKNFGIQIRLEVLFGKGFVTTVVVRGSKRATRSGLLRSSPSRNLESSISRGVGRSSCVRDKVGALTRLLTIRKILIARLWLSPRSAFVVVALYFISLQLILSICAKKNKK